MRPSAKTKSTAAEEVVVGLFSKKEAAGLIAGGTHHVHSSSLGQRDVMALRTNEAIAQKKILTYPWEGLDTATTYVLSSSRNRHELIRQITGEQGSGWKRDLRQKVESVLEELSTNALYHSYHKKDGAPKFPRRTPVELADQEKITLKINSGNEGIFLSIRDQGGSFAFDAVARAFTRCYGAAGQQIEAKEGGAGLGVYMVFEAVTHLKIVCAPGGFTEISCWIADHRTFDPDHFSFNFFDGR